MDRAGDEGRHDLTSTRDLTGEGPAPLPGDADENPSPAAVRRAPVWLLIHLGTLAIAAVVLFWVNRNQWFFGDEWEFLFNRGFFNPAWSIWYPHNEHWSTLPVLAFSILRDSVGLGRYWPFIGVLIAVHLLLTHLLWRAMVRAGVTPLIATAAAAVFALFGAGSENLLWAFQIGFVGSLAAGWAAALIVDGADRLSRRDGWAAALLVVSLMCSGIGIPAVAFVALLAFARARSLLRPIVVGGIPAVVFGLWYLITPQFPKPPWTAPVDDGVWVLAGHVVKGLRDSLTWTLAVPAIIGLILLVMVSTWTVVKTVDVVRGRPGAVDQAIALAGGYGAAGFFLLSGFGRGDTSSSRYVYVAIAMALPALALALSGLARPRWARVIVAIGLAVVLTINIGALLERSSAEAQREQAVRATVLAAAALVATGEPTVTLQPEPTYDPDITAAALARLIDDGALPITRVPADDLTRARLRLQINPDPPPGEPDTGTNPASVEQQDGLAVENDPAQPAERLCLQASVTGDDPNLVLQMPGGQSTLTVTAQAGGELRMSLPGENEAATQRVESLEPGQTRVVLTSLPAQSSLRLVLPGPSSVVCGVLT